MAPRSFVTNIKPGDTLGAGAQTLARGIVKKIAGGSLNLKRARRRRAGQQREASRLCARDANGIE
jgi:hypothetical protein